ncbi:hypothetical protein DRN98_06630, partial [Methanosarcinales archaeon]
MIEGIVERFAKHGYQLHPDAARMLCEQMVEDSQIKEILSSIDESTIVICPSDISCFCEANGKRNRGTFNVLLDLSDVQIDAVDEWGFVKRFRDRYERLSRILQSRLNVRSIKSLERVKKLDVDQIGIVGIVSEINKTPNGHTIIDLEDMTGRFPVLLMKDKLNVNIVLDEVIGVQGSLTKKGELFVADKIFFPDIFSNFTPNHADVESFAVFISDIHMGNCTFIDDAWERFIAWMRGELGGERE